jgi:uncharacterized protein YfaS (alpha-2-macroglobulin family)
MKTTSFFTSRHGAIALALLALLRLATAADAAPPQSASAESPVAVFPNKQSLAYWQRQDRSIRVTFPTPMVELDQIGRAGLPSPIALEPIDAIGWVWVSQMEGRLDPLNVRDVLHRVKLRAGLTDLAGKPVGAGDWGFDFADETFAIKKLVFVGAGYDLERSEPGDQTAMYPGQVVNRPLTAAEERLLPYIERRKRDAKLQARAQVHLEFSRDVDPKEVARAAYFQEVDTGKRYPVEIELDELQKPGPLGWMTVAPKESLPAGHAYLFVIEQLKAAKAGEILPRLLTVPAGTTYPPKIVRISGLHQPQRGLFIRLRLNQNVDPDRAAAMTGITIQPPVANLRGVPSREDLEIFGDFDKRTEYVVTVPAGWKTGEGFPLPDASTWKVHFHAKRPAVIIDEELVFRRASAGVVSCSVRQVNTGRLQWKIAAIPTEALSEIRKRLREFGSELRDKQYKPLYDPKTGEYLYPATELLIPRLGLPVLAAGDFAAAGGDEDTLREVAWKVPDRNPGIYLLEIAGRDASGTRLVGNRTIICRSDWLINRVQTATADIVRVRSMSDGKPVQGVPVVAFKGGGFFGQENLTEPTAPPAVTNANGEVFFKERQPGAVFLVGPLGRQVIHFGSLPTFPSGNAPYNIQPEQGKPPTMRCVLVTDRNLYRPGETVHVKGFARISTAAGLRIPAGERIAFEVWVGSASYHRTFYTGAAMVNADGSFEGHWVIPATAYGSYVIGAGGGEAEVQVAEIRPPPFSVTSQTEDTQGETVRLKVSSRHFHGAPNAGAKVRWKAEWVAEETGRRVRMRRGRDEDGFPLAGWTLSDNYSAEVQGHTGEWDIKTGWEDARETRAAVSSVVRGEAALDANGMVTIECKSPFPAPTALGRARVYWIAEVSSATGEMLRGGAVATVQLVPKILGVQLDRAEGRNVDIKIGSFDLQSQSAGGLATKAELFRVETKTVKQKFSEELHRYRNTPVFTKVWEARVVTPFAQKVPVPANGDYVLRASAVEQSRTPAASAGVMIDGDTPSGVAVRDDHSLDLKPDQPSYKAGDNASIALHLPAPGVAMVTVETDRILHREYVEFKGNTQRITLLAKPEYSPNAFVTVHWIQSDRGDGVPVERFGWCELKVERPDRQLVVTPTLRNPAMEPGQQAEGIVKVKTPDGAPVGRAEVLVFAVDEAILAFGRWKLPAVLGGLIPDREWQVETHLALDRMWAPPKRAALSHSEKGFILGDVGFALGDIEFRKQFKPLAFWNASMTTQANGEVPFAFKVPDGLTSYRVVAVAQHGFERFGDGQIHLRVSKPLQVEPALPAFLRQGDKVSLRTVLRQDYADSDELEVTIRTDKGFELAEAVTKRVTALRGQPVLVSFAGSVPSGVSRAKIGFAARSTARQEAKDAQEDSLAIHPAAIERRETISGAITAAQPFDVPAAAPPEWLGSKGSCDVMLSGTSDLPKLAGLPALIEAQGSVEKLSSRVLAATLLAESLKYLPSSGDPNQQLRTKVEDGLKRIAASTLDSGSGVPLWPGANDINKPMNEFVTIETAWAIRNAFLRGFPVDAKLKRRADLWLAEILRQQIGRETVSPAMRCFALMVYGSTRDPALRGIKPQRGQEDVTDISNYEQEAKDLFDRRAKFTGQNQDEARAWLALGLHYLDILPRERFQLLSELGRSPADAVFDPPSFSSQTRVEAIRLLALTEITATNWSADQRRRIRQAFDRISQSSIDLSTQENLWLLHLFNSLSRGEIPASMGDRAFAPKPTALSENKITAGWMGVPLDRIRETFAKPLRPGLPGSYLLRATYEIPEARPASSKGLKLTRALRNLTAPARTGAEAAPFQPGDQVMVTYELNSAQAHSYLEIEDQLPAGFETVNPRMPMVMQYFRVPIEAGVNTLALSHVELRYSRTLLYFDRALPGRNVYSVVARVVAPGTFHWPATQARPLYDSRFSGLTESAVIHVQ